MIHDSTDLLWGIKEVWLIVINKRIKGSGGYASGCGLADGYYGKCECQSDQYRQPKNATLHLPWSMKGGLLTLRCECMQPV